MAKQFNLKEFNDWLNKRNPNQAEFVQAVSDLAKDVLHPIQDSADYQQEKVLHRLTEPDRIISFRVCWEDDNGEIQINRGWRVQHSNLIGPYKGGIRFHPTVNESILKFLAFEQTFKNALTGFSIGGGKGGADFDPKGRSNREIMRFCQAYMNELYRHIGENTDVPAGDINVGNREIGYLFGQYRRLANHFTGALTGKDIEFGGSHVRTEATGYGLIYFVEQVLQQCDKKITEQTICISGCGNVALHAAQKAIELGAKVVSLASSKGTLQSKQGFSAKNIGDLLASEKDSTSKLKELARQKDKTWLAKKTPWHIPCDIALPCATQNELTKSDAINLKDNHCFLIAEGANMPCTNKAIAVFEEYKILHVPGKASNAGGVALSGLEMEQNASFSSIPFAELDNKLKSIMQEIHAQCVEYGQKNNGYIHYRQGANQAAFQRVASALIAQGIG
ncbi:NADP-specific glutamate dehydrogenase [Catenovulum sediminis]|uniref:NADP-specific glutamate dehydrogenase n=1 Tax=Catenovulum sediminis TaxID=1740262 RepID=UPI00117F4154|nr:NADP-specific glutamate dehydrogenase [Catenovulum sediminis]